MGDVTQPPTPLHPFCLYRKCQFNFKSANVTNKPLPPLRSACCRCLCRCHCSGCRHHALKSRQQKFVKQTNRGNTQAAAARLPFVLAAAASSRFPAVPNFVISSRFQLHPSTVQNEMPKRRLQQQRQTVWGRAGRGEKKDTGRGRERGRGRVSVTECRGQGGAMQRMHCSNVIVVAHINRAKRVRVQSVPVCSVCL